MNKTIQFLIWGACMLFIGLLFLVSLPAYEDSCKLKMDLNIDEISLTDSNLINQRVDCQNYFNGHIIWEYWANYIATIIIISLLWIVIVLLIEEGQY